MNKVLVYLKVKSVRREVVRDRSVVGPREVGRSLSSVKCMIAGRGWGDSQQSACPWPEVADNREQQLAVNGETHGKGGRWRVSLTPNMP